MKKKLMWVLHFLKLDVLLLRVLEALSAGLTKCCVAFREAVARFVCCRECATKA